MGKTLNDTHTVPNLFNHKHFCCLFENCNADEISKYLSHCIHPFALFLSGHWGYHIHHSRGHHNQIGSSWESPHDRVLGGEPHGKLGQEHGKLEHGQLGLEHGKLGHGQLGLEHGKLGQHGQQGQGHRQEQGHRGLEGHKGHWHKKPPKGPRK